MAPIIELVLIFSIELNMRSKRKFFTQRIAQALSWDIGNAKVSVYAWNLELFSMQDWRPIGWFSPTFSLLFTL